MVNSKLFGWLFGVLLVAMTIGGAMAYTSWQQPLQPDPQNSNASRSYMTMTHWLRTDNYASNCSIPSSTLFSTAVDNLTRTIWVLGYSTIDLYDTECNLLFQIALNGKTWGSGYIDDWDNDLNPNFIIPLHTPDNTMSLASYEWNFANLTNDRTIDLGTGVSTCSGVYCERGMGGLCAVFCNDNIKRVNLSSSTYTNLASQITGFNYGRDSFANTGAWSNSAYIPDMSPIQNSITTGDIDLDGHQEIAYYSVCRYVSSNSYYGFQFQFYDLIDNTIDLNHTDCDYFSYAYGSGTGQSGQTGVSYSGSPIVIGKTGAPNSVPKLFLAYNGDNLAVAHGGRFHIKVVDMNWNTLQNINTAGGVDWRFSNWMIGDIDTDGNYEHCLVYQGNLSCWRGNTLVKACVVPDYSGESVYSKAISSLMLDIDGDGQKEFISPYGIRSPTDCSVEGQDFGITSTDWVSFVPVDLSNDGKLDLILTNNITSGVFLNTGAGSGGTNCSRTTCPYSNCQFYDDFDYLCAVNDNGWNLQNYPPTDIYPTGDERMCYDGDLLSLQSWEQSPTFYTTQINEFDINVSTSYQASKELIYYDSTEGEPIPVWHLDFWEDGSISYFGSGGWANSLCGAGCIQPDQYNHIKVISYFFTTNGATFYNSTSHQYEYNHPNTFSIIINNATRFDNLDLYNNLTYGNSNSIWGVEYVWQDKTCIDNEVLRGDLSSYGNETGCNSGFDYYTYPIVWVDTFPYADTITNHGWSGYPYVVGDNVYDLCNVLFIDTNISLNPVNYTFLPPLTSDFVMKWDMWLESSLGNNTYDPIGMPTQITFEKSDGTHLIHINFNSAGEIVNVLHGGGSQVLGAWDGSAEFSYKVIPNFANHTFAFYFTNASNNFEYVEGCSDCAWENNGTINKFVITPYPIDPYGYTNIGIWVDNVYLTMGGTEQNFSDTQNFCNFEGCIFYDPFNYTDDTYAHGWYMFNTTPDNGVVNYSNSTQGYYFEHQIDTIHSTDNGGIFSVQFKAMFPTPPQTALDLIHFQLYNGEGAKPIDIEFSNGIIFDVNRGVASLGSYSYNSWNTYTLLVNMNTGTYNLYMNSNQLVNNGVMTIPATEIIKGGFWVNTDSAILIDYITIASGSIMVDAIGNGIVSDTGVPIADLKWCWSTTNGTFDWSCCSAEEISTKSMWCPARTTFRYALGGITNFVLGNFIYFLIIVIIFVIITPYIAPIIRGDRR